MRRRRLAFALLGMWIILAQPASVAASAYSTLTYGAVWIPPGYSTAASVCEQAGIVDVARNYAQTVVKTYVSGKCTGSSYTVDPGFIGTQVAGYKDNGLCGTSSVYYSNVATSAWQLWITLCPNPAGSQSFRSTGYGYYWVNVYNRIGPVNSPSQNY